MSEAKIVIRSRYDGYNWTVELIIGRWRRRLTDSRGHSGCTGCFIGREWARRTARIWSQRLDIPIEKPKGEE